MTYFVYSFFVLILYWIQTVCATDLSAADYLTHGSTALGMENFDQAVEHYQSGIAALGQHDALVTVLSLYTNLGTTLSSLDNEHKAVEAYRTALTIFTEKIEMLTDEEEILESKGIASQAAFYLGMVYQSLGRTRLAADTYAFANTIDPYHWSSMGNLGAILHDELGAHEEALMAYNKAYEILTQTKVEPTDPPENARFMLSELQYRIGLCITHDVNRRCALMDDPTTEVPCKELATNAFAMAVKFNPDHESAKHMLATITADATMKRASNTYVKSLFDNYAKNFEHSLVSELGYTGFERLRLGFDRAFGGSDRIPIFPLVIDAGCGTGLVGEQFRNISQYLIGVDLSEAIIDEANKMRPGLYNTTIVGDIAEVFRDKRPISLIIAADSYIYFGDLGPLFQSMSYGLGDGGFAAFTLENVGVDSEEALVAARPDWRWQLTASGRFAHRKQYVEDVGAQHRLRVLHYEPLNDFRFENGIGVRGHIFVMQKTGLEVKEEL